jgi:hypothetical protein
MGFSLVLGEKRKMRKLVRNYVDHRIKEKKTFSQQIKHLETQLDSNVIDKPSYERLRVILETQYYQKQQEQWTKIENRFQNPLNT